MSSFPEAIQTERLILGSVLESNDLLNSLVQELERDDFFIEPHRIIFVALQDLAKKKESIDLHILTEALKTTGNLDKIGGTAYLNELFQLSMHHHHYSDYVEIVKEKSILRKMIGFGQCLITESVGIPKDIMQFVDQKQIDFIALTKKGLGKCGYTAKEILNGETGADNKSFIDTITERQAYFKKTGTVLPDPTIMPSGYPDLDKIIGGLGRGQLILIAGRPGMGKTTFALNIAFNLAIAGSVPGAIFSIEMSADEVLYKIISRASEIPLKSIVEGRLDSFEYTKVYGTIKKMAEKMLIIDETGSLDIATLRMRARRMKELYDIEFLILDYIQLVASLSKVDNRNVEVSQISRGLKLLAKELKIPVIAISQLSRKQEDRTSKHPILSDLRDSGALEQDADKVIFVHRPEYFDPYKRRGEADIITAKNRQGETGTCTLLFRGNSSVFLNFSKKSEDDEPDYLQPN